MTAHIPGEGVRAISEPLPFKGHRTLAEVWKITLGTEQNWNVPKLKPSKERLESKESVNDAR